MKALQIAAAGVLIVGLSSAASADVKIQIQNGHVSLVAKDATVRQILMEWARVGQTKIVNVERIPGGPQTIELTNVPETEALEILLHSITGYMAAPRGATAGSTANLSQFDRIVVMPTTAAPRPSASAAPPPTSQPVFAQPQLPPQQADDEVDDERPAAQGPQGQPQRGPIFNQFPPPQVVNPQTGQPMNMPRPGTLPEPQVNPATGQPMPTGQQRRSAALRCLAWSRRRRPSRGSSPDNHPDARADDSPLPFVDEVNAAIADAMRKHEPLRLGALRMLKAALMNREVERGRALDDGEVRQVVTTLVKQRRDSIEQFTKGGRQDLADKEAAEIRVLEAYLPPAADPALIERAVAEAIAETGASSAKDMGRVMKAAMARLADQTVDGKAVNELVRRKLSS
jgi:uncharacterized protein YqeY